MSIEIQLGGPVTRPLWPFTCTTFEMLHASITESLCGIAAIMRAVNSIMSLMAWLCSNIMLSSRRTYNDMSCQGARHQILLYCILYHKTTITQACHRALQISAPLGSVSDSQAIKELSDLEPVLHMYMCTLDGAATLFRLCSDSLHCNSCMQKPIQNLYVCGCMFVPIQLHS